MDLQDSSVSSSLKSWSSQETVCFGTEGELENSEFACAVCRIPPPEEFCEELNRQWEENNSCLLVANNIVYLKCRVCHKLHHLSCISETITADDLVTYQEEDYSCILCREEGKHIFAVLSTL